MKIVFMIQLPIEWLPESIDTSDMNFSVVEEEE